MTANIFYEPWWLRPISWAAGCFPAKEARNKRTPYGVEGALRLVKSGYTLVIFPEGRLARDGRLPAKTGTVRILNDLNNPDLILGRITWRRHTVQSIVFARQPEWSDDPEALLDGIYGLGELREERAKIEL